MLNSPCVISRAIFERTGIINGIFIFLSLINSPNRKKVSFPKSDVGIQMSGRIERVLASGGQGTRIEI